MWMWFTINKHVSQNAHPADGHSEKLACLCLSLCQKTFLLPSDWSQSAGLDMGHVGPVYNKLQQVPSLCAMWVQSAARNWDWAPSHSLKMVQCRWKTFMVGQSSDSCLMGFIYSIQIYKISRQTFGPSPRKCPTCLMFFAYTTGGEIVSPLILWTWWIWICCRKIWKKKDIFGFSLLWSSDTIGYQTCFM